MSGDKKIRVGSRKSELALIQTRFVISSLTNIYPNREFEIVTMSTLGDKVLDIPLPKIGEKSLFTKELETALATGCVDFVVHSLKDLPTVLPEGMAIGAVLEREDPRDALVVRKDMQASNLNDLKPGSIIGTSSLRRTAQLAKSHPTLNVESIRGNLNTRMRKLDELDKFSAIVLAQAGLCRMGWQDRITKVLTCNEMLYAVGQGALAVECRENDLETLNLLQHLHCPDTLLRILAERSFLKTLGGGCSAPVAVSTKLTPFEDKLSLQLTGGVWSLDGQTELKDSEKCTVEIKPLDKTPNANSSFCPLGFTGAPYVTTSQKSTPLSYGTPSKLEFPDENSENSSRKLIDSNETLMKIGAPQCGNCPRKFPGAAHRAPEADLTPAGGPEKLVCPYKDVQKSAKTFGMNFEPGKNLMCPYGASPCKRQKTEGLSGGPAPQDLLQDPHEHCPVSLPVGLDFMGKCPYLDSHEPGRCPVNAEIQNMTGEHSGEKATKCPFFKDGKFTLKSGENSAEISQSKTAEGKINAVEKSTPLVCPYREPKLYCGTVPSKRTPLWALEQAEHLGINLAEKLLKHGALEVMQAAQAQIRGTV